MGLIETLRQKRGQEEQSKLAVAAQYEKTQQEKAARRAIEGDDRSRAFIEEAVIVDQILSHLIEAEYVKYLHSLVGHGFDYARSSVLFMKGRLDGLHRGSKLVPYIYAYDSTLTEQELAVRQNLAGKIKETSLFHLSSGAEGCLGEFSLRDPNELEHPVYMDPETLFFGDQLARGAGKKPQPVVPTEPTGAGVGFRFSKIIDERRKYWSEKREAINGPLFTQWVEITRDYSAFYVSVRNLHHAVVTGATFQEEVDLSASGLNKFNQILEEVAVKPFSPAFTTTRKEIVPTGSGLSS